MDEELPDTNEAAAHRAEREGPPLESPDPIAPDPASPAEPEFENDEAGRLRRLADAALATGKQAADATVSGSRKATAAAGTAAASAGQAMGNNAEKAVAASASAAQAVGSGTAKAGVAGGRAVATGARWAFDSTSERTAQLFAAAQGLVASDLSPQLNDLVQAAVKGKATIYDKAMDAVFLETHIGGGNHRLFDGGHTLLGAIKATHSASSDDTLIQEALGGMQGLLRDVSTPKGLPLATWDKSTFDSVAESLKSTFGIPKSWFYDLNSYDVGELLGGTVGVVSLIFGWNRAETESFASLAAGMGMSAAVSANPLLLAVSVVAFGRAFHKANHADEYVELAEGALKGSFGTGSSLGAIALVGVAGGPAGVALLAGVTAGVLAHVVTKDVQLDAVCSFVNDEARTVMGQVSAQAAAIGDCTSNLSTRAGSAVAQGATAAVGAAGKQAARAGRVIAGQAAVAGSAVAGVAAATGRVTQEGSSSVIAAVRAVGSSSKQQSSDAQRERDLDDSPEQARHLPVLDDRTDDEILGYDEHGLPT